LGYILYEDAVNKYKDALNVKGIAFIYVLRFTVSVIISET
jgi:hypothetical protein